MGEAGGGRLLAEWRSRHAAGVWAQVRLIAISSVLTGLFFGLTFGVLDLEDELIKSHYHMRHALQTESRICYPVGACAGMLSALAGQLLELQAEHTDADLAYIRNARHDFL